MSTPLVREAGILAGLPDAIESYIRPLPGRTNFALFPWSAFLLARLGETIDALLAGLAASQAEASPPAAACHASPRLVVCNAPRESRSRVEPRLREPEGAHSGAMARAPVDEPVA